MSEEVVKKGRDVFWDVVKGVSIIAVILIHTTGRYTEGGAVWRQVINFPVAMFFFLAAYFCHCEGSVGDFLVKKAKRLLVPYIVFSLLYAALDIHFKMRHGLTIDAHVGKESLFSFSLGWGYFVLALFQFVCLYPIMKDKSVKWLAWFAGICFAVSLGYCWCAETVLKGYGLYGRMMPFVLFLPWTPMFVLGVVAKRGGLGMRMKWILGGCVAFFVLSVAEGVLYLKAGMYELSFSQTKLGSLGFSFFLAILLLRIFSPRLLHSPSLPLLHSSTPPLLHFFSLLGRYSFFIYLSHRLVLIMLRGTFHRMDPNLFFWFLPVATIVVEYVLIRLMDVLPTTLRKRLWIVGT